MPKPERQALLDELATPRHADRKKVGDVRRVVAPLIEALHAQATRLLRLHSDFVDAEDNDELTAMQEELRQKALAARRIATELEERAHKAYEVMLDLERFGQRFLAKAAANV